MLEKLKGKAQTIDVIEKENVEPVTIDEIEKAIKIIEAAKEIDCDFKIRFALKIDDFIVDSASFNGIKIIKNKKENNKLLIQYQNLLFSSDTYIDLNNIIGINISCQYITGECYNG